MSQDLRMKKSQKTPLDKITQHARSQTYLPYVGAIITNNSQTNCILRISTVFLTLF